MGNILIVLPSDNLGGAEQYLKMIATHYLRKGYNVFVFFLYEEKSFFWRDITDKNLHLYFTNKTSELGGLWPMLANIIKVRRITFDYIFTSHLHINAFIAILITLKIIKKKYFIIRESTSVFTRYRGKQLLLSNLLYRIGYSKRIDLLICQTNFMRDQLIKGLPWIISRTKVLTISNPIDLKTGINIEKDSEDTISSLYQDDYVVSAGRLIPEKGFDILLRAFAELHKVYPTLKLIILGEGKERNKLMQMSSKLGLHKNVFLPGHQKNVYPYFKYSKLCVVSSRIEGFPNVLLQMMSQNSKVVSTKCAGGIDDIPGIFIAETESTDSLLKGMMTAMQHDTSLNRVQFDTYLASKDIENFINQVNKELP